MVTIREVINSIVWRGACRECFVILEDRLVGDGLARLSMCEIERVDRHYVYFKHGKVVPIHRVKRIVCGDDVVLERF